MAARYPLECRIVGFSSELDWRPLRFVEPFPEDKVCRACGVVRRDSALLPCGHVLCESCYPQCADSTTCICPFDGEPWSADAAQWSTFSSEELLSKTVICWNEENGCAAVMAARILSTHFQHDCKHHATRCLNCSTKVLCNSVCTHMRSNCRPQSTALASSGPAMPIQQFQIDIVACVRRALREEAGEMTSDLARIVSNSSMHCDRLDELSHDINGFKESVTEQHLQSVGVLRYATEAVSGGTAIINAHHQSLLDTSSDEEAFRQHVAGELQHCRDDLSQHRREFAAAVEQLRERLTSRDSVASDLLTLARRARGSEAVHRCRRVFSANRGQFSQAGRAITAAARQGAGNYSEHMADTSRNPQTTIDLAMTSCEFVVRGVKYLENTAVSNGCACYDSEPVYLGGYCITPAVRFLRRDTVTVHVYLRLKKGEMDDMVSWPFKRAIKMVIRHPTTDETKELVVNQYCLFPCFQKPDEANGGYCFPGPSFKLSDLVNYGYLQDDQLEVKWELLA